MKIVSIALLAFALGQAPPVDKPPTIPTILLKNFYAADAAQQRAQRALDQAQHAAQAASTDWKQAIDAMQKACGEKFELYQDSVNADPQCRLKPPVPEKPLVPKPTIKEQK